MAYVFLSPEWIEAAREVHDEFAARIEAPDEPIKMNVTVFDAPIGDGEVLGHIDTTEGPAIPELGHVEGAALAVRVPYETARQMLVDQDPEALLVAFMSGEIEVEGDVTLIMDMQGLDPTQEQYAVAEEIAGRMRSITA